MKYLVLVLLSLVSAHAWPGSDAVQTCREEHAGNADAHIACLEAALLAVTGMDAGPDAADVAAPSAAARDDEPAGLGAEQLRAQPRPEEAAIDSVQVRIIYARYDAQGVGTFQTEDGQVWRETMAAPDRWRLDPERQYDARIERGKLGGYRLHVDGIRYMLTVRRLK
jgi:hypothetical protein